MNVLALYNKYAGQSLSYDNVVKNRGQCVQWAEYVLTDSQYGYGLSPFWGNAIDWWNNYGGSLEAFDKITDGSIKAGDIVIFNSLVGSVYGHIDMALQDGTIDSFLGADSNWAGNLTVHQVQHVGRQYVVGSLRLKSNQGITEMIDQNHLNALTMAYFKRGPNAQEEAQWLNKGTYQQVIEAFDASDEYKQVQAKWYGATTDAAQQKLNQISQIIGS